MANQIKRAMKKIILLTLTALVMSGCDERLQDGTYRPHSGAYKVYVIDSCEYYGVLDNGNQNYLAHKGNCHFCKERRQKELEELLIKLKEK